MARKLHPVEPALRGNLLALARGYAAARGIALATVAKRFYGDHRFFEELAAGEVSFTVRKYDEVARKLLADWPAGSEVPVLAQVRAPARRPRSPSATRRDEHGQKGGQGGKAIADAAGG